MPAVAVNGAATPATAPPPPPTAPTSSGVSRRSKASRAGDDAKLIFGTVFSLRNMVRKLGGDDDAFICYRTSQYKLHYYETASNTRFVMLTDTATLSMRNVLHQVYINLWVEYGASFCFLSWSWLCPPRIWRCWAVLGLSCGGE